MAKKPKSEPKIFTGCNQLVSEAFNLPEGQCLTQKTTCLALSEDKLDENAISDLMENMYHQIGVNIGVDIDMNKSDRLPLKVRSDENWRMSQEPKIDPHNTSCETILEKSIGALPQWYNQCPIASGMIDKSPDKKTDGATPAIDLLCIDKQHADFIELKYEADTPASAAMQILRYGLAYLFSRDWKNQLIYANKGNGSFFYKDNVLLNMQSVDLKVLAPACYYAGYNHDNLGFLQPLITEGLTKMCAQLNNGLTMSFSFWSFPDEPDDFKLPSKTTGADVHAINNDASPDPDWCKELIHAVNNRKVWCP